MQKNKNQKEINTNNSRRRFLGQAGLAVGAAFLPASVIRAGTSSTGVEGSVEAGNAEKVRWEVNMVQTGWNTYSTRYVYAPVWTWQPVKGAAAYMVAFADADDQEARVIRIGSPEYDMAKDWDNIANGPVDMIAWAVDEKDNPICSAWRKRFNKSPGFDGKAQKPENWQASLDRAMTYLLAPARDKVEDFEGDMPRSCWSSCEESMSGQRRLMSFPALHHPSYIFAFLQYAQQFPAGKHAATALKQAKQYGDWLLVNRWPADWKCGLFPFSTIQQGKMEGYIEGKNITLFRAARVGEAMIALYKQFNDKKYLDYARHIANVFTELQQADGSWPYRVNPLDGKTVEAYTSNAVSPARLLGMLEQIEPNASYAASRGKAIKWVMENPVKNKRWQGMFEDIGAKVPYQNLEHWDTNEMIRYIGHYHRNDPATVTIAEELNHYIEDQFVVWQTGDRSLSDQCPTPTVMEQYACYRAMEVHTGMWIMSLIALHRATGRKEYITKAINAGNSIVRSQQQTGAYSTWGYDIRFKRPLLTMDWPGCNAVAVSALLQLNRYVQSLPASANEEQPL
jgi:hypothetical protein